jgi:hypothetical protein
MLSKCSTGKKVAAAVLLVAGLSVALLVVLSVDGRLYERWKCMMVLRNDYSAWVRDGSPYPIPDPTKYGQPNWGTTYVDSVSYMIDGIHYRGLYAIRDYTRPDHLAVTTNGVFLVLRDDGSARLLWIHKTRGAAW